MLMRARPINPPLIRQPLRTAGESNSGLGMSKTEVQRGGGAEGRKGREGGKREEEDQKEGRGRKWGGAQEPHGPHLYLLGKALLA